MTIGPTVGDWRVRPDLNRIEGPRGVADLEPKVIELLLFLARHPGETLSRSQILEEVWQGAAVVDGALSRAVSVLRRALGDSVQAPRYVQTVPQRGYRLVAPVEWALNQPGSELESEPDLGPDLGPEVASRDRVERRHRIPTLLTGGLLIALFIAFTARWSGSVPQTSADRDPEATRYCQEGRRELTRRTVVALRSGRDFFERAITRDPSLAEAHAGLADAYVLLAIYRAWDAQEALPRARAAAREALRADPDSADGWAALGWVELNQRWNFAASAAAYARAIAAEPRHAEALRRFAELRSLEGHHAEALELIERARAERPFSLLVQATRGVVLENAGHYEDASLEFRRVIASGPEFGWAQRHLAYSLSRLGHEEEAVSLRLAQLLVRNIPEAEKQALRASVAQDGMAGVFRWLADAWAARAARGTDVPAPLLSEAYAGLGELDLARFWTERAIEERGESLLYLLRSPAFDQLRGDPSFRSAFEAHGIAAALDVLPPRPIPDALP